MASRSMKWVVVLCASWPTEAIVGSYATLSADLPCGRMHIESNGTHSMSDPDDERKWIERWRDEHHAAFEGAKRAATELCGVAKGPLQPTTIPFGDEKLYLQLPRALTPAEIAKIIAAIERAQRLRRERMDAPRFASVTARSGPLCVTVTTIFGASDGADAVAKWQTMRRDLAAKMLAPMLKTLAREKRWRTIPCDDALKEASEDDVATVKGPMRFGMPLRDVILPDGASAYVHVGLAAAPTEEDRQLLQHYLSVDAGSLYGMYSGDDENDRSTGARDFSGEYAHVRFRSGSNEPIPLSLTITKTGGELRVMGKRAPLAYLSISDGLFWAELPPGTDLGEPLPALQGRFVTRYPPANAKGPVREGLRLGRELFGKVTSTARPSDPRRP